MAVSIRKLTNTISDNRDGYAIDKALQSVVTDLIALKAAHVALAAKLDADAGVTDTNYSALTNPTLNTTA